MSSITNCSVKIITVMFICILAVAYFVFAEELHFQTLNPFTGSPDGVRTEEDLAGLIPLYAIAKIYDDGVVVGDSDMTSLNFIGSVVTEAPDKQINVDTTETDTLQTVTDRGATTDKTITVNGMTDGTTTITGGTITDGTASLVGGSLTSVKLGTLTSNGFVKTSSSDGTLSVDTSTYLTGNETITLSGDVSGSGATAITTTIGSDKILESMLKAVNAAVDEYALTYESTTGDFEWTELSSGTTTAAWQIWAVTNEIYKIGVINGMYSSPYGDGYYFGGVEPTFGDDAQNVIVIEADTVPTSSPVNAVQLYSEAITTGGNDEYTVLLLHLDGADGATTTTDSSASEHSITFVDNAQLDTAQKELGSASVLFDNAGDYLYAADSSDWDFDAGDLTIDYWVRWDTAPSAENYMLAQRVDASNYADYGGWYNNGLYFRYVVGGNQKAGYKCTWTSPTADTWYHVAMVRNSSTCYLFIDGDSKSVTTDVAFNGSLSGIASNLFIGAFNAGYGQYWDGWLDEIRVSKGIARWTANFTPPTVEYDSGTSAELKSRDEDGNVTSLSTAAEISPDCDCPYPIIKKKRNNLIGKMVEIRECCMARNSEDGGHRKVMWVKDIPIKQVGKKLPEWLSTRRVSELERRALWAEAKRQKEIEFQEAERERIANITESDEPDTGVIP